MSSTSPLHVVCALVRHADRVLATRRDPRRSFPLLWEFPGGKLEEGESGEEALHRELEEELNLKVDIVGRLDPVEFASDGHHIVLHPFVCRPALPHGPLPLDHIELRWVTAEEALQLTWAPADIPLLKYLSNNNSRPIAMDHYNYQKNLKQLWQKAVTLYEAGNRSSGTLFDQRETAFLAAIGHTAQEVYDFAEDAVKYGEPDFETFLLIASLRRHYFLNVMNAQPGDKVVDTGDLPAKTDEVRGIRWLPRLIAKARAKLRGEMSDDLMYCCGGDREFFKNHNLHPAEFLTIVMNHFSDDAAIIDFVERRKKTAAHS